MTRNPAYTRIDSAPPAAFFPDHGRKLVEEFNDLRLRYNRANLAAVRFSGDGHIEQQARNADAEAVATATRKGKTLPEPNQHMLDYFAKRNQMQADASALKAALDQVSREFTTWAIEHADEIADHAAEQLEQAHAAYLAVIPDVQNVANTYHHTRGLTNWARQLLEGSSIVSYVEHSGGVTQAITDDASQHIPKTRNTSKASGF